MDLFMQQMATMQYLATLQQKQNLSAMSQVSYYPAQYHASPYSPMILPTQYQTNQDVKKILSDDSDDGSNDSSDDTDQRTIFVANLDERVTEEILYELFLLAGPIESVCIPKESNGKQRTFGFVTYVHLSAPGYAMQLLHGLELYKKRVTIKFKNNSTAIKNHMLPAELIEQFGPIHQQQQHQSFSRGNRLNGISLFTKNEANDFRNNYNANSGDGGSGSDGGRIRERRSFHDAKPYDRGNNTPRDKHRRSDPQSDRRSDYNRNRINHQYHNVGGNRRSEQRYNRKI